MTTSGQGTYLPVRNVIINGALRLVGATGNNKDARPEQITEAITHLNLMLKTWQLKHGLWLKTFVTVFMVPGQEAYSLPGANGSETVVKCELVSVSGTAVVVDDNDGISASDIIGIKLDDGSIHWDVVANVSGTTGITLTTGTTDSAEDGNPIYAYAAASPLFRPTRIERASRIDENDYEAPLNSSSRADYQSKTNKKSTGTPVEFYYDPQTTIGKLYLWPAPVNAGTRIVLDCDRPLQIMEDAADQYDLPMEWQEAAMYGVAIRLAPIYGLPIQERTKLETMFTALMDTLLDNSIDWTPTYFAPGE